jgi:hypothetical protein
MGWKGSFIVIEQKDSAADEKAILKALGKEHLQLAGERTFWQVLYPRDGSINIGYYNGNIIICDDYLFTSDAHSTNENLELSPEGENLVALFPRSEILSIAFHSATNFHAYTLIQNGKKQRFKAIDSDMGIIQAGKRMPEEELIYASSYEVTGKYFWKNEKYPEEDWTEDQLMEKFAFSIAKRRLGVMLDQPEADELMDKTIFKRYHDPHSQPQGHKKKNRWVGYALVAVALITWQIIKRTITK